jgi:hypothetical protein
MPQTIDATGLSAEAVDLIERLVAMLRTCPPVQTPNQLDPEAWSAALRRWAESHPKREIEIDDSRETIYAGRGE